MGRNLLVMSWAMHQSAMPNALIADLMKEMSVALLARNSWTVAMGAWSEASNAVARQGSTRLSSKCSLQKMLPPAMISACPMESSMATSVEQPRFAGLVLTIAALTIYQG